MKIPVLEQTWNFIKKKTLAQVSVLSLKKYVPALLSHMQIYKIMLCPHDKFS